MALSWLLSPLTIAICRRKSTRLTAVLGGLVAALGLLFTSFASRFHQLFISYGTIFGELTVGFLWYVQFDFIASEREARSEFPLTYSYTTQI